MAKKRFFLGALAMALVFGLALAGCTGFDGSTLAGTTWVSEDEANADMESMGMKKVKMTLKFSSDTEGTATAEVTQWTEGATAEQKQKVTGLLALFNGAFTSTYDKTTKTGTLKMPSNDEPETFTVDAAKKELAVKGETSTDIYKLQ